MAQAAGRIHAEEHAAASGRELSCRDFGRRRFQNVLPDTQVENADASVLVAPARSATTCAWSATSGTDSTIGIIFLEQLYPWPEAELQAALDAHPDASEIVWVQEEPANMGALTFVMPRLRRIARGPPGDSA